MNFSFRPALALLLGASAALLTACDYKYSPGVNMQFTHNFSNPPGYTSTDVYRDSVNFKENVYTPIGKGSATALKNGSTNDQLNSAPAGKSSATPQNASGTVGPVDQAQPSGNTPSSGNQ